MFKLTVELDTTYDLMVVGAIVELVTGKKDGHVPTCALPAIIDACFGMFSSEIAVSGTDEGDLSRIVLYAERFVRDLKELSEEKTQ